MSFNNEKEMADQFKTFYKNLLRKKNLILLEEYKGLFGRPDFIVLERLENNIETIIAFELKLKNWQTALKQAYRYRAFAHMSFVIMDEQNINSPINQISQFIKFNIGLGAFNCNNEFKIFYAPEVRTPYSLRYVKQINDVLPYNKKYNNFFLTQSNSTSTSNLINTITSFEILTPILV